MTVRIDPAVAGCGVLAGGLVVALWLLAVGQAVGLIRDTMRGRK